MKKKTYRTAVAAAFGMLILILDGKTALQGANDGISLCLTALIPSLFPFIFLSSLLTGALSGQAITLLRPFTQFCHMPVGTESLLAVGFLGGYPVGAQCIAQLRKQGQLSDTEAMRLIAFCNNAGPSFIFGILATMFSDRKIPWILWMVHMISALSVGFLLPRGIIITNAEVQPRRSGIMEAFTQAVKATVSICGWVILMRVVIAIMDSWFLWLLPQPLKILAEGILELSNGCIHLAELECEGLRFLMAAILLSLGGISVTLQTAAVGDGVSLKLYFPGKILQCTVSIMLCSLLQFLFPVSERFDCRTLAAISSAFFVVILLFLKHSEKSSGIPATISV